MVLLFIQDLECGRQVQDTQDAKLEGVASPHLQLGGAMDMPPENFQWLILKDLTST